MKYDKAIQTAEGLIDSLRPACIHPDAISIAGSLRRGVQKDYEEIDLIMIPDSTVLPPPRIHFGDPMPSKRDLQSTKLDKILQELEDGGRISYFISNGPKQKRAILRDSAISLDLYLVTPPATWGVQLLIRTGPQDFGHWIVTRRSGRAHSAIYGDVRGGALPDGYRVQGGAVWEGEEKLLPESKLFEKTPIGFQTEESFLEWLGLGWIDPGDRAARWGKI